MNLKMYPIVLSLFLLCACKDAKKEVAEQLEVSNETTQLVISPSLYEDLEGNPIKLDDYKGKRVLLNFWATWCRPCIEEMPSLLKAQERLKAEGYVFLLASDQSVEKIKAFKAKKNFNFNYIKLTGSLADIKIQALPTTFIYNAKGERVDEITGGVEWDSEEMIGRLLKVQ